MKLQNEQMIKISYILLFVGLFIGSLSCKEKKTIKAGQEMQQFIIELSQFARNQNPAFILIPQNGEEVLFQNINSENELHSELIQAIDGIGTEEIFYNGDSYLPDEYRLGMLRKAQTKIKVLVADNLGQDSEYNNALQVAANENFIAFPRYTNNYDYKYIPSTVFEENSNPINTLKEAKNYLYLISTDGFPDKSAFLSAIQQTNFDVVIIDAFYDDVLLTKSEVESLKTKANGAKRLVISYMSIGSAEKYRYYWKKGWGLHHPLFLKRKYPGYEDEIFVKYWSKQWKAIIFGNTDSYTQKILNCGFDGAYLDNIEAFYSLYHKD